MKKYKFISTLRYLSISEPIEGWITLMPGIDITNDKNLILSIIDCEFKETAGVIEYEHFIHADNIIYCDIDDTVFDKGEDSHKALFIWLFWLKMLLNDLWFIKDNAVICEAAFCKLTDSKHSAWTRNNLTSPAFMNSGKSFTNIEMTIEDLKKWNEKSDQIQSYLCNSKSTFKDSFTNMHFSRIGRSMRFIEAASRESHPAVKLAHYCSAFESLFSTDSSELTHKLSERVALFLKDFGFDPIEVFDDLKSFYGIRSKVIHGDSLKTNKELFLSDMSQKCDNYLRCILNIIFSDDKLLALFDGKKDYFEKFFKNKLFMMT
ncbi:HEPN domain-containing protein [Pseudoalteromonas rhizosphaerae]|uniref:HEPN domain-containing protein n=1 Tax=Pseudoalteromonas rhizosphaerae TaxID=2518973 RepID=UPI0021498030|nr:HEPN domain-containing protein [Pseudoalteromonas rhizosphaerae]